MIAKAVFKKDEARVFEVLAFDGENVLIREYGQKEKSLKKKTFRKSYKIIEGELEVSTTDTTSYEEPAPAHPEPPNPQDFTKYVEQCISIKPDGVTHHEFTVDIKAGMKIEDIDEADFIQEMVEQYGAIHGDKVKVRGFERSNLGKIDLNGDQPSFAFLQPEVLQHQTPEDSDTITLVYATDGRKVTMSRREFYAKTTAVTLKEKGAVPPPPPPPAVNMLPEDPLPEDFGAAGEKKETKGWALVGMNNPEAKDDTKEAPENSMRANRDAKAGEAQPFVPNPFFLRQSMISSYQQCPSKMYDSYENGYNESSIFTKVGTAIHGVMEDYYNLIKVGGDPKDFDTKAVFDKWWAEHAVSDWDWYETWIELVDKYFEKQKKYDPPVIIGTEIEFRTTINGVPVSGTIDRIDRVDDQTIQIIDYKTNFQAFTPVQLDESTQFMMYTSAVKTPEVRELLRSMGDTGEFNVVVCSYEMLRLGMRQSTVYDEDQLATFERWMAVIWTKILTGADREPKLNQYCGFCQKRYNCPVYQEVLNAPVSPIKTENTDIAEIIREKDRLAQRTKILKNRLDEIDAQIKQAIGESGGVLEVDGYEWTTKVGNRYSYPANDVFRILAMNGLGTMIPEIVSISNTNLNKALKANKGVLEKIENVKQVSYTNPSLNKKKIKPKK